MANRNHRSRTDRRRRVRCSLCSLAFAIPASLGAQTDTLSPVLSRIDIVRENIFDSTEAAPWYAQLINGLHARTRDFVVRRELLIRQRQRFDSALIAESARNLRRLGFFREVALDTLSDSSGHILRVTTKDRWTTKGSAAARITGGQLILNLGLTEANLGGSGVSLGFRYRTEPDRHSFRLALTVPRAVAGTDVGARIDRLTDGNITLGALMLPFRSLSDRRAMTIELVDLDRRVLRWRDGIVDPVDSLRRVLQQARLYAGYAWLAGTGGYLRSDATLLLRREDFGAYLRGAPIGRSRFAALGTTIEASRARFHLTQGLRTSGIDEDVNLSPTIRAGLWMSPAPWGYERSGLGVELMLLGGSLLLGGRGFAVGQLAASGRSAGGLDSGTIRAAGALIVRPVREHLFALYAGGGAQRSPAPGLELDLGFTSGPRAFPVHSFTGDRMYQATAEYQYTVTRDLLGRRIASLGVAAFVDRGGAWYAGEARRQGTDVGFGLRLGSPRVPTTNGLVRIDLSYRYANDVLPARWVISIGNGFPFDIPH